MERDEKKEAKTIMRKALVLLMLVGLLYVLRSHFVQLFSLFRLDLLLIAMGIVVVSGVVICVVSTYFVVGRLVRLEKGELYY